MMVFGKGGKFTLESAAAVRHNSRGISCLERHDYDSCSLSGAI
jgi:hypothetical protein